VRVLLAPEIEMDACLAYGGVNTSISHGQPQISAALNSQTTSTAVVVGDNAMSNGAANISH
jgi:deoxyxylulose-5-phosphate synthase